MLYQQNSITTFLRLWIDVYNCTYTQLTVVAIFFCACLQKKIGRNWFLPYRFLFSRKHLMLWQRWLLAVHSDLSLIKITRIWIFVNVALTWNSFPSHNFVSVGNDLNRNNRALPIKYMIPRFWYRPVIMWNLLVYPNLFCVWEKSCTFNCYFGHVIAEVS